MQYNEICQAFISDKNPLRLHLKNSRTRYNKPLPVMQIQIKDIDAFIA
jgi:hypothetical protein